MAGLRTVPWRLVVIALITLAVSGAVLVLRRPSVAAPLPFRPVTDARLLAADSAPGEWLTYGRDYASQRFSPLTQIDRHNVTRLTRLGHYDRHRFSRSPDRNESTPVAVDGMLIYSDSRNVVLALDARSGRELWRPRAPAGRDGGLLRRSSGPSLTSRWRTSSRPRRCGACGLPRATAAAATGLLPPTRRRPGCSRSRRATPR